MSRRPRPFDRRLGGAWPAAIGVDEVGRGAWCGPVVAAAVWFDPARADDALMAALDDSKRLSPPARVEAAGMIRARTRWALAAAAAPRIDALGMTAALMAAMVQAVTRLRRGGPAPGPVLIDGRQTPPGLAAEAVVGGDRARPQIAAASIVAKVARDALMARLAARWPGYGWESNVGYGARAHREGVRAYGVTPHHRRRFAPVAAALSQENAP